MHVEVVVCVYYCSTYYKAVREGGGIGGHVLRELLFIAAVPNTKLCAWGEEDSGGHVL